MPKPVRAIGYVLEQSLHVVAIMYLASGSLYSSCFEISEAPKYLNNPVSLSIFFYFAILDKQIIE
ncbi:MAG: hypothetical protein LBJ00_09215 [Planctomycetaceae bacterium]|jgi:hypothetical protein|nr:hypothetical protein [Planctomycetaceae bacterium]